MPSELEIIHRIGRHLGQPDALVHDAYYDPQDRAIYTTDMLIEGRHFDMGYFSPGDLGWKAAAVNISDIAATGGKLRYLLISLGLPEGTGMDFIDGFYQGLSEAAHVYGGQIIGGDTVGAPVLTINVTAVGELPSRQVPGRRHMAEAGDTIVATGFHGLSKVGLQVLKQDLPGYDSARRAHLRPHPKIEEGLYLSYRFSRYAMMDSSDGLADAAFKIAQASGVKMILESERLRIHPDVAAFCGEKAMDAVLYGGEDFELVATVSAVDSLPEGWNIVGYVAQGEGQPGAYIKEGKSITALSQDRTYQHFGPDHA